MPSQAFANEFTKTEEFDSPAELFDWIKRIHDLAKFRRTRDAILANEPLYDYRSKELNQRGYLGPWQFNLMQSTLSGLPAFIIPLCTRLLHIQSASERQNALEELLKSFAWPFVLMLTAYVVGRASLWKRDASEAAKKRAARIFLYLDGAYGLYTQMAVTAAWPILAFAPDLGPSIRFLWVWQFIVSMGTIPDQLLDLSRFLRQRVKTQNSSNGELSHEIVSQAVHQGVQVGRGTAAGARGFHRRGGTSVGSKSERAASLAA